MAIILLTEWAKRNNIKHMDAKNMARRGRINAILQETAIIRWTIDENEKPPTDKRRTKSPTL